ncbi:hypothetical protein OSB04_000664 [Centaurea solstitialis]|uniref:Integrase catalytic domain-containing protein n=1 Tax=Centaurea solstitialis TaxID=347529 RepID=A0AA38U8W8_9ASTR|nr:hypothetical protein OSB04_000664 [Centaurea solstitialis]
MATLLVWGSLYHLYGSQKSPLFYGSAKPQHEAAEVARGGKGLRLRDPLSPGKGEYGGGCFESEREYLTPSSTVHEITGKRERIKGQLDQLAADSRGLLTRYGRVWVSVSCEERQTLLNEAHKSKFSIHPGATKMYRDLRTDYWWPGMNWDVAKYVKCLTCLRVKAEHQKPHGKLQSLEIPEWKWEHVTMDLVTRLPRTLRKHDAIWVVVDRLTKSAHFIAIREASSLEVLADIYSRFHEELGTKLQFSTAFHPQTDGQSERTIRTLEDMLRACVLDFGGSWESHLPLVEFSYNNSFYARIGMPPYEMLYGRRCRTPICWGEVGQRELGSTEIVQRTTDSIQLICERLKAKVMQIRGDQILSFVWEKRDRIFDIGCVCFSLRFPTMVSEPLPKPTDQMSKSVVPFYTPEESLHLINGKWKLTGQNFPVWKMHLDNVLSAQGKLYVLEKPVSRPKSNSPEEEFAKYFKYLADESDVMSILIFSISPEYGKLLIMKEILSLKLEKNQSSKDHLINIRRLFKCLTRLGYKMAQEELMHLMWYSLPKEICDTASAYMKEPRKDVAMLHEDILASLEPKPTPAELMDSDWIDELGDLSCPECGSQDICEHSMNIDQIEIGLPDAPGSGNHICNHLQGFTRRETLRKDRSNLRVGEGTPLIAEAVESYSLSLPSGVVLELENCYYVPKMIKNYLQDDNKEIYHISKRSKDIEDQTYLWHYRLGHINKKRVELLLKGGFLGTFDFKPFDNCKSCLSGKMTKEPFNKDNERASDLLEIVHTDVCGPFSHEARGGYRYFITFTDDFSRYGYVYLMRHKSESFEKFREYHNEVQNQLDRKIKFLQSDRGGEYLSQEFGNHLMECGIVSQLTPPYTPQMNGVSERRNRTLLDMVRSMMCHSTLLVSFWGHALETAAHILNRAPTKSVEKTPYELWKEKFLSSGNTREDVDLQVVDEENTTPTVEPEIQYENVEPQSEPIEEVQTQDLCRSTRVRQEPDRYLGFLVSQVGGDLKEPTSYGEAVSGSESEQWQEAMKAEMQSMYDNQVWELTDLPQHCRAVGRKWVFKKKTDMDGNVHTFKARLVAKGFTQTHGIDYDETFSPVAMLKSIRILMAISAYFNYEIWQMDVKTTFMNGKLTEDVYMEQPEGFEDPNNPNKVCKLLKSIYGLKQASRSWNLHFDERIKEFGCAKSEFEPCVYIKFSGSIVTFLVLYVDDILLIGNDVPTLQSVKSWLRKCIQMKDLGEAAYILGIKIYRNRSKWLIGLSQSTYIDKILKKFMMDESKKGFIPMQHGIVLSKTQCPVSSQDQDKMKSVPYASAIGSIMYAMLCTRPDVAYSVSVTSRYQQNPGEPHWVVVKNILKYLRRTKEMFLVFGGSEDEISVIGYSDATIQTDRDDFRSQSGYVFTLNGGAISWKSSKQDTIADSTTEAEYIAASDAAKEAVWLRNFLSDLRVVASVSRPIDIFCDNSGAVTQAKEPREHHKSRHVLRKYHLIREIIGRGDEPVSWAVFEDFFLKDRTTKFSKMDRNGSWAVFGGLAELHGCWAEAHFDLGFNIWFSWPNWPMNT